MEHTNPSIQLVTWPNQPGQYLQGPLPSETVASSGALMTILSELNMRLHGNETDETEQGGMR